jgi:hypothetical protein
MKSALRWIAGISVFLAAPAIGMSAGGKAAFWYTYYFLDDDRAGNADVATNISFLGLSVIFGSIGFVVGFIIGWIVLARLIAAKTHATPEPRVMEG